MHTESFNTKKNINNIKIALISDIHYHPTYKKNIFDKIENQIKKESPDYICIVGDILDESKYTDLSSLISWLIKLSKTSEIIITYGNHDEKYLQNKKWTYKKNTILYNNLKDYNRIHFLDNNSITINNIHFYGFNPSFEHYITHKESYASFYNEVNNLNPDFKNNNYNIFLLHTPMNIYTFLKNNPQHQLNKCDLILSGHMHNGCIPLFITNFINKVFKTSIGLITPRGLFSKYSQGKIFHIKDGYIYEGLVKLSNSSAGFLKYLDFIYPKNITIINIKKGN